MSGPALRLRSHGDQRGSTELQGKPAGPMLLRKRYGEKTMKRTMAISVALIAFMIVPEALFAQM